MGNNGRANEESLVCFFDPQSNIIAIGARDEFGNRVRDRRFDLLFGNNISYI
jgi:hypothetical protein